MRKSLDIPERHEDVVIRRTGALEVMRSQLLTAKGKPKFTDSADRRVIYASPLVDVAANMELVRETVEACLLILTLTHWQIRLLSKSHMLPKIAEALGDKGRDRVIYGVSTGTLDDRLAQAFEAGTPRVSKRIESLRALQDAGYRTFGMICPSLPQPDYSAFANECAEAIRPEFCEHIWAEVINVRGESMVRTENALRAAGFDSIADDLHRVSTDKAAWEEYSRFTFTAHSSVFPQEKLRFLQYVNAGNRVWWEGKVGAVLL